MKKIITLLLFFTMNVDAQSNFSFSDIAGKWIEQTRTDKRNDVIAFKDTIYMEIRDDGFMLVRHTIGATFFGDANLSENVLSLQKAKYTVENVEENMLKLKDGKILHRFTKQTEIENTPSVRIIPGVEKGMVSINPNKLFGKWTVYKKTDANFNQKTFYIKNIEIENMTGVNEYLGNITMHNMDSVYNENATMQIDETGMQIKIGGGILKHTFLKNDGDEMILTKGSVTYFLKRFGKK